MVVMDIVSRKSLNCVDRLGQRDLAGYVDDVEKFG